jgi:hypothetical protein
MSKLTAMITLLVRLCIHAERFKFNVCGLFVAIPCVRTQILYLITVKVLIFIEL